MSILNPFVVFKKVGKTDCRNAKLNTFTRFLFKDREGGERSAVLLRAYRESGHPEGESFWKYFTSWAERNEGRTEELREQDLQTFQDEVQVDEEDGEEDEE